jgi:osmotically-inducible protein OsmY
MAPGQTAQAMIDAPLDDRVLTALERNPYVSRRNLRFEIHQGRVTLQGVVGSYFQKQMAQEAIRRVEGVEEIANELEVSRPGQATRRDPPARCGARWAYAERAPAAP